MTDTKPIRIPVSRRKMALIAIGAAAFVAGGSLLAFTDSAQASVTRVVFGWVAMVFFGAALLYPAWRLIKPGVALLVDEGGVTDGSSGLAVGFIPWSEIRGVQLVECGGQRFIGIDLHDPSFLLSRVGRLRSKAIEWNQSRGLPPVLIPQIAIREPMEELVSRVSEFWYDLGVQEGDPGTP
jgi:hypothetical protein